MDKVTLASAAAIGVLAFAPSQYGIASISTGVGAPGAGLCTTQRAGHLYVDISSGRLFSCDLAGAWKGGAMASEVGGGPGGLPSGAIIFITSGTCPVGTSEATELNGRVAVGTLAANANVGTTGGTDTITPAGTNAAPTFTGTPTTDVVNHLHTLATGTTATGNFAQVIGTIDTSSGGTGASPTQTALATRTGNPVAGGVASYTPAGTISAPAFTGIQFDNRPAFVRVIACRAS